MAKCSATTATGQPCKGEAIPGANYCWSHDPSHSEQRKRIATKAGKRGGRGRPGVDLQEIKDQLRTMLGGVLSGRILPGVAAVACQIQNTRLRCVEVERKLQETQELLERIEALEELARPQSQSQRPKAHSPQPGRSYQ
jgi:hypothetical protein